MCLRVQKRRLLVLFDSADCPARSRWGFEVISLGRVGVCAGYRKTRDAPMMYVINFPEGDHVSVPVQDMRPCFGLRNLPLGQSVPAVPGDL